MIRDLSLNRLISVTRVIRNIETRLEEPNVLFDRTIHSLEAFSIVTSTSPSQFHKFTSRKITTTTNEFCCRSLPANKKKIIPHYPYYNTPHLLLPGIHHTQFTPDSICDSIPCTRESARENQPSCQQQAFHSISSATRRTSVSSTQYPTDCVP